MAFGSGVVPRGVVSGWGLWHWIRGGPTGCGLGGGAFNLKKKFPLNEYDHEKLEN